MHQFPDAAREVAVGVKVVFFNTQGAVTPVQVARMVVFDSMAKDQVLRPSGRANGIRLNKTQTANCSFQTLWREQGVRDCVHA